MRRRAIPALLALLVTAAAVPTAAQAAPAAKTPSLGQLSSYFSLPNGGSTVTISGANFKGATKVSFGGVAASFKVVSTSTITATVPPRAVGVVDVRVNVGTAVSGTGDHSKFVYHSQAPAGASVKLGTYVPMVSFCQPGFTCRWISVTTAGFAAPVTCRVTKSDAGAFGSVWTQPAATTYESPISFGGTTLEITCDGVKGSRSSW